MEKNHEGVLFLRHPASTMILYLDSSCSTEEELAYKIKDFSQYFKDEIKCALPFSRNNDLRKKFYNAFNIIDLKRIEDFVKAVKDESSDEFLAKLSLSDKCSLKMKMLLMNEQLACIGINSEEEHQYCLEILGNAIDKEFEQEAIKCGFNFEDLKLQFPSHRTITLPEPLSEVKIPVDEKPIEKVKK